jgi:2-dehydro-3-deoxyphosphogluconate aldolase/(4S)-4-hydroxy-2-oxoglutarate aldolase
MSEQRARTVSAIERAGVVAVIRLHDPTQLRPVVDALIHGGIQALEVTMTVPRAVDAIAALAPSLPDGFLLGAGTVLDGDSALRAIEAGARFIVSPVFRRDVLTASHRLDSVIESQVLDGSRRPARAERGQTRYCQTIARVSSHPAPCPRENGRASSP